MQKQSQKIFSFGLVVVVLLALVALKYKLPSPPFTVANAPAPDKQLGKFKVGQVRVSGGGTCEYLTAGTETTEYPFGVIASCDFAHTGDTLYFRYGQVKLRNFTALVPFAISGMDAAELRDQGYTFEEVK